MYDSAKAEISELLRLYRSPNMLDHGLSQLWSASQHILILAQGAFIVEGNETRAQKQFSEIADWMPYFDASVGAKGVLAMQVDGKPLRFDARLMLEPLTCVLLAGDRVIALRMARVDESVYLGREGLTKSDFESREFVLDICRLIRGEAGDQVGLMDIRRSGGQDMLPGYETLLRAIAGNDAEEFEGHLTRLSQAYRHRAKSREQSVDAFGFGKLAQSMTFDALGTALCRLAVWRGLKIKIDNPLYPPAFWR